MFTRLSKWLLGTLTGVAALAFAADAQAQRVRSYNNGYSGRYYTQRPVYDNGRPNEIVTMTPQGPVRSSKYIDPATGHEISTTYWRDPRTGQVTTSRRIVDPRTGKETASTRTTDPYSGSVQRSRVDQDRYTGQYAESTSGRDPYSGVPYRSRSTYDPYYGETYEHSDPYWGGSRVTVPYRPYYGR